ncbi:MAG: pyridoxamine 5'-phosphate oxidase [Micavibrio sp.]
MNTDYALYTDDPYKTFAAWLEEAKAAEINDPNAMNLATADTRGRPSNRMVLLNGLDERGFVFFTNVESRKGGELTENPHAALCFHWKSLRRQVRIEGKAEAVTDEEADAYYNSRPRISRIGSWASRQSRPLPVFSDLEEAVKKYDAQFTNGDAIPRPPYWRGFRIAPERIEFWIDGEFRLHRRHVFELENGGWKNYMIYP